MSSLRSKGATGAGEPLVAAEDGVDPGRADNRPANDRPGLPLLATKLRRPPIPSEFVPRPRLYELLRAPSKRRFTLVSAPAGPQKSLGATLNFYVFLTAGQDGSQQPQDEAARYSWAVQHTGSDFFDLGARSQQDAAQVEATKQQNARATRGAGVHGAPRGAAWSALIGEIADDDAGKRGSLRGLRRARRFRAQAKQQVENFKRAFSVCLEAKSYTVK